MQYALDYLDSVMFHNVRSAFLMFVAEVKAEVPAPNAQVSFWTLNGHRDADEIGRLCHCSPNHEKGLRP